jgi:hypothetical protein
MRCGCIVRLRLSASSVANFAEQIENKMMASAIFITATLWPIGSELGCEDEDALDGSIHGIPP